MIVSLHLQESVKCKINLLSKPMDNNIISAMTTDLQTCPGLWHIKAFSSFQACMKTTHSF